MPKNKAISFDLITDGLFEIVRNKKGDYTQDTLQRAASLRNLWDSSLINSQNFQLCLESRLIPLNKKFPLIPKVSEIRPIVVSSLLIKFLELRFSKKLRDYMVNQLERSQTGFVPEMGTEVNLIRLFKICHQRRKHKPLLLFIDFSNAYNTIFHKKLFQILSEKNILSFDEIEFLVGLYSKNKIRIGKSIFKPQRGVMQGSPISPYLFNIYSESLITQLKQKGLREDEILAYADDICIVSYSIHQLKTIITTIEEWTTENGLLLNKNKSGILQVTENRQRITLNQKEINGIPVVKSYKYLGIHINSKINLEHHIAQLQPKVNYLTQRLKWIPHKEASLHLRANLWTTFIRPLINMSLPFEILGNKTQKDKMEQWSRRTFKKLCGITKTVGNLIIDQLIGFNQIDKAEQIIKRGEIKWIHRKKYENNYSNQSIDQENTKKLTKWIPNSFIKMINIIGKKICPKCKNRLTPLHLKENHKIDIGFWSPLSDLNNLRLNRITKSDFKEKYDAVVNMVNDFL